MSKVEARLEQLGLTLPPALEPPPGLTLPFKPVIVHGDRVYISGHAPQSADGTLAGPFGKVGSDLTIEQGVEAARQVGLSILGDLKRALGDLDRVTAWLRVLGMVNVAPGFNMTTPIINGFSELIIDLYGPEQGAHTRSAVGMAVLPLDIPVEIEAEVAIST